MVSLKLEHVDDATAWLEQMLMFSCLECIGCLAVSSLLTVLSKFSIILCGRCFMNKIAWFCSRLKYLSTLEDLNIVPTCLS